MVQSAVSPPRTFVRDAVVSTLMLVGLYGLAQGVQFPPLQIPGYLLIVGFDALERIFGSAGTHYYLLFGVYILGLGVIGAAVSTILRNQSRAADLTDWRVGIAGALAAIGSISLLFSLGVLVSSSQLAPVLITGVAGVVLLALAGWLAGVVGTDAHRR